MFDNSSYGVILVFNEQEYESKVIKTFIDNNYKFIDSAELLHIRKDLGQVILFENLENCVKRINDGISQADVNAIVDIVRRSHNANLILGNKNCMKLLVEGVKVYDSTSNLTNTYKLIDYDNVSSNEFVVTNQFKMTSKHYTYENQIPDVVVYINGLPISVIELKSPTIDESKSTVDAFDQLKNYQDNMPTLFTWNAFNVISNMHISRYGSLTASYTRFSNWRDREQSSMEPYKHFFINLYDHNNLLRIIKDFSFYTTGDEPSKIVAGYHQFLGVSETVDSVIEAMDSGSGKAGIFWHTQGSGKSLSMVFLTRQVNNIKKKMTTLIITDRKDLDNQLSQTFMSASDYLGQEVKQIESISDLKETLNNRVQNGIYLCTVQKFDETIGELSLRDDILIISDEAHRSHKNILGQLSVIEDEFKIEERFGNAYYLREAFPKATFIGFTGTPIESDDHQTKSIFGDYATKYLMTDATSDGFVVPIAYESRHAILEIASEKKEMLDQLYEYIKSEVLDNVDLKGEVQKHINKKIQKMDIIIGDPDRINEIAHDFVKHYHSRKNLLKGKAMFVTYNREIAYKYYKKIIEIDPSLKDNIRMILTANNQKDSDEMLRLIGNNKYRKESAKEFKDPNSDFKIAIVVDMWLTGFDAPCLDTLYLDKPIKMHNLMQTIARVNRTYTDKENPEIIKENGLVVDYIGLWKKLQDALAFYTLGGDKILDCAPEDVNIIKAELLDYVKELYSFDLDNKVDIDCTKTNDKEYLFDLVELIQRVVIEKKQKQHFVNRTKKLKNTFSSVLTACSYEEKITIQLLVTARSMIIKRELGNLDIDFKVNEIKEQIADSIIHNRTVINDKLGEDEISLSNIISIITSSVENGSSLDAEKLTVATRKAIAGLAKINIVKSEKLTSKLQTLIDKYDSGYISIEEFFDNLRILGYELEESIAESNSSDKDMVELSFFEIIKDDEYTQNEFDHYMVEKITKELYEKVKPLLNSKWLHTESIKQNVRSEMKKILIKHGYPPTDTTRLQGKLVSQLSSQIYTVLSEKERHNGING